MLSQSIYLIFDVAPQVSSLYVMSGLIWLDYNLSSYQPDMLESIEEVSDISLLCVDSDYWLYLFFNVESSRGLVPNFSDPMVCVFSDRRSRSSIVSHVNPGRQSTLALNMFKWRSIRIFNRFPTHIRNITTCSVYWQV